MAWGIWGIIALVLLIIEVFTVDLTFVMLAGGALAAMLAALFTSSWIIQLIAFVIVSVLLLIFVRPVIRSHMKVSTKRESNVYALAGQQVRALTDITTDNGRAKIGGEEWSARCIAGVIKEGELAIVDHVDGVYLVLSASQPAAEQSNGDASATEPTA